MTFLVTGVAGFIGFHVANYLCKKGFKVIGIDNLNDYYEISLKKARLKELEKHKKAELFEFYKIDISDFSKLKKTLEKDKKNITKVIHLAAQAGVRYSLDHPFKYADSNLTGHLSILELCRGLPNLEHLIYASSSSVYGNNDELPYDVGQRTDNPISLYAATKKSAELMSYSYSHLYNIPMTGLRFFTVYGHWGRPDMAYYKFTKAIFENRPIDVFAKGKLKRDFTYIDDIVDGIIGISKKIPKKTKNAPAHKIYNLGNDKTEEVLRMIKILEEAIGKKAKIKFLPMQPGDMKETHANIKDSRKDFGFNPKVKIDQGLPEFVQWYKSYNRL